MMRTLWLGLALAVVANPQQATFRSSVDVVLVPVSVTEGNRPVAGLTTGDFQLLDNGVKQTVNVSPMEGLPSDVTFVVDTSGSVNGPALERIKQDVQAMAGQLDSTDRVRLVSFARDAIDVFDQQPGGSTLDFSRMTAGGTTSLYDSLVTVLAAFPSTDRPHMVFVVTDGLDNSSFTDASRVVAVAQRSSAVLCVALVSSSNPLIREGGNIEAVDPMASEASAVRVPNSPINVGTGGVGITNGMRPNAGLRTVTRNMGPYRGGPNTNKLEDAADATGGLVYKDSTRTPIPELFARVLQEFRSRYLVTYTPNGVSPDGFHTIEVKMPNGKYNVKARRGYQGSLQPSPSPRS